jgi:hypothetical protein
MTGPSRFDSGQKQRIFPLTSISRPALGPTQYPMGTGRPSPVLKSDRGVTLTTHHHLVPRSRMSRSYSFSPHKRHSGVLWDSFSLNVEVGVIHSFHSALKRMIIQSHCHIPWGVTWLLMGWVVSTLPASDDCYPECGFVVDLGIFNQITVLYLRCDNRFLEPSFTNIQLLDALSFDV